MTTIVYRDGVLASDSQCQASRSRQPGSLTKIWRIKGRLVAGCGKSTHIERFRKWVETGMRGQAPDMGDESSGIVIEPDGRVREFEECGEITTLTAPFYAWGTGMPAALGALYMGATAERAVEVAMLVDINSGGPVQSLKL